MINEYEAAVEYGFSPDLLRWLTENAVVDGVKLPFNEKHKVYYFSRKDLDELDSKMSGKWPLSSKGKRPHVPEGIANEIKRESYCCCPICHRNQGEVAHINAVAKTLCNHPKNLIFLCPNHHSEYDLGYAAKNVSIEDVKAFKEALRRFSKHQWAIKGKIIQSYLGALNTAVSLLEIHEVVGKSVDDKVFAAAMKGVAKAIDAKKGRPKVTLKLESLKGEIKDYTASHSEQLCPLCHGKGATNYYDVCPICLGNGDSTDGREDLLAYYELIDCPLCEGSGRRNGDDCPGCDGDRKVPRGWADNHDWSQYDLIDCPLCEGSGKRNGDDCPGCDGDRKVPRGWADKQDWSQYDLIDCPLCEGLGKRYGDDCPGCDGDRKVQRGWADNHDWSQYDG